MTAPTVTPPSPFDRHIATLNRTDLMSLLAARHSVRSFTDRPIEEGAVEQLQAEADALNERLGLSIQLCLDNPEAFDGRLAHYGSFRNVRNHIALVGPTRPGLDEACGYAGERLVLLAQELGLNTCWVALTYSKKASAARVAAGEKFVCCIALGYGEKAGAAHKVKRSRSLAERPPARNSLRRPPGSLLVSRPLNSLLPPSTSSAFASSLPPTNTPCTPGRCPPSHVGTSTLASLSCTSSLAPTVPLVIGSLPERPLTKR